MIKLHQKDWKQAGLAETYNTRLFAWLLVEVEYAETVRQVNCFMPRRSKSNEADKRTLRRFSQPAFGMTTLYESPEGPLIEYGPFLPS